MMRICTLCGGGDGRVHHHLVMCAPPVDARNTIDARFVCVCVYLTSNTQQVRRASRYTHTHERARSMRCVFICEPHRSIHTLSGAQSVRRHRGAADRRARIRSVLAYLGLRLANARHGNRQCTAAAAYNYRVSGVVSPRMRVDVRERAGRACACTQARTRLLMGALSGKA